MRIYILSDLHLEFAVFTPPQVDCDVVILAGDTNLKLRGIRWALETFPNKPVLYVFGNHEFYGEKWPRLIEKGKALAAGANVRVLENDTCEINGWRFFGATLWSDFLITGDQVVAVQNARSEITDFKSIRHWPSLKRFAPHHAQQAHAETKNHLRAFLASGDRAKSIVITHHAPSMHSQTVEFRNDPLSGAYVSDLEPLISEQGPVLWIHGHIHHQSDYQIHQTRILANPRGYPGQLGWRDNLVIEI